MSALTEGDLVTLVSGSPRMAVESFEGKMINLVWINEGIVHRDSFNIALLRKWEDRPDDRKSFDRGAPRSGGFDRKGGDDRRGGGGGFDRKSGGDRKGGFDRKGGDDRKGGGKSYGAPKDKGFFRKD